MVDFQKALEEAREKREKAMLAPLDDDLDVITVLDEATGQQVELRPLDDNETSIDIYSGGKRTPRLAITQNSDDSRAPGLPAGTFFLTHSVFALDEEDGTGKAEKQIIVIGEEMPEVHLLGLREVRNYFRKKYAPDSEQKPDCSSIDGKRPDPKYVAAGNAPAPFCVGKDKNGKTVPACPMAKWVTEGTGDDAERIPPKCVYAIQAGFAVQMEDGEWLVFDAYFKRTAELAGKQLFQAAMTLKNRGYESLMYPVRIKGAIPKKKVGRIFLAMISDQQVELDDETLARLQELRTLWMNTQIDNVARAKSQGLPAPAAVPGIPANTAAELDRVFGTNDDVGEPMV